MQNKDDFDEDLSKYRKAPSIPENSIISEHYSKSNETKMFPVCSFLK